MDIKNIFLAVIKNKILFFGSIFIFTLSAVAIYYLLPNKYYSSGSFFVSREPERSGSFFTYDGFYSQQTAQSYTNTVLALLESQDILFTSLRDLKVQATEATLRRFQRNIDVKKAGPQLITLTVKGNSSGTAEDTWNALALNFTSKFKELSKKGDVKVVLIQVNEKPIIKSGYKSLAVNILVGILSGTLFGFMLVSSKEYLND